MPIQDNAVRVLHRYLSILKAPVTVTTIAQTLTRHPHYPSLLAVSDGLRAWHIDHMTVRVKPEQLADVPTPFFTQLTVGEGEFAVVNSVSGGIVRWWHSERGWQREPIAEFLPKWTPIALVAELSDTSGEVDYRAKHRHEQAARFRKLLVWIGSVVSVLLTVALLVMNIAGTMPWTWLTLLLTKLTGTLVSFRLIQQTNDPSGKESGLCRIHKTVGCNAVLKSPAATFWGGISWVEIGLVYFAGGSLAVVTGFTDAFVWAALWCFGLLALPYVLFSIYYQARVIRKWCTWCLIVQGLLLTEATVLLTTKPDWSWSPHGAALVSLVFLLPVMSWMYVRPILKDANQKRQLTHQLNQFRNDPQLFATLLHRQERMVSLPDGLQPIVLGNPQAGCTITLVINPYCEPCAKALANIQTMFDTYPWLNGQILFAISTDETDPRTTFVRSLYALPAQERVNALASWLTVNNKTVNVGRRFFAAKTSGPDAQKQVAMLQWWNANAAISVTPTIYVSGHKLPPHYILPDLPYLIKYGLPNQPTPGVVQHTQEAVLV